jgi:hypothetical protein
VQCTKRLRKDGTRKKLHADFAVLCTATVLGGNLPYFALQPVAPLPERFDPRAWRASAMRVSDRRSTSLTARREVRITALAKDNETAAEQLGAALTEDAT